MKRKIGIVALALMLVFAFVGLTACEVTDGKTYKITVKTAQHGKVAVSASTATEGTDITVTLTPDTGYKVSEVKQNGTALTVKDGKATFKMPAADVEITATFVEESKPTPGQHKVTVSAVKGGEVSVDKALAAKDEIVTVTAVAKFGYTLTAVKVDGTAIEAKDGAYTFAMLDKDVEVTAEFALSQDAATDSVPAKVAAHFTSRAMAGAVATADIVLAYADNGLALTAYVADSTVTSADGVALYVGREVYANKTIGENNLGIEVLVGGSKVYKVTDGNYVVDTAASVTTSLVAWANNGEVVGYKVTAEIPYALMGITKADAENKLTVLPVLYNNDRTMVNAQTYEEGVVDNADTYYVLADGALSQNYYLYGAGTLGQGDSKIATGSAWDLSQDYSEDSLQYADRKAVLNGNDGDNNIVMWRKKGVNLYAKATFKLIGMGNPTERWGKFGIMLYDGQTSNDKNGVFFYVDAYIGGEEGQKTIDQIQGRGLGYNLGNESGWGAWVGINGTSEAFDLSTKTITLALATGEDGMVYMYLGNKLVGQTAFRTTADTVIGFKSFGYNMEVTDYSVIDNSDENFAQWIKPYTKQDVDVLFLGDSYMDFWKNLNSEDGMGWRMQTAAIESTDNIGIGGTQIPFWTGNIFYVKKLYNVDKFVFHIGVNDIDNGATADEAYDRLIKMLDVYRKAFPDAEIYWVSLIHNTMFADKCAEYDKMNKLVYDYAANSANDYLTYIDVTSVGVDSEGNTRVDMFYDGLHLNKEWGYPQWAKLIMAGLGYEQSTGNDVLGDYDISHVANGNWTYNEDGTVVNTAEGANVLWYKGMQYSANFYLTANVTSPSKTFADVWTKVGLFAANDTYKVFGYIDVADSLNEGDRRWAQLVYSKRTANQYNIAYESGWQWGAQGTRNIFDVLVESTTVKIGLAKVGNTMYMFVNDKIVSTLVLEGTEDETFIGGILGFHRNMTVSNVTATTGTADEIALLMGVKAADATLDGVADDSIWTEEVLGNTQDYGSRADGGHYTLAAVKGTDGVYFLANVWHKSPIGTVLQGNGAEWWNYLNLEFRLGNNMETQQAVWFKDGKALGYGAVVGGNCVTVTDGELYKTTTEFFVPYRYFDGYTSESNEIPVKIHGWVSDELWQEVGKTITVSTHGLRNEHNITVSEATGATVTVDKTARKGDKIDIDIALEEGYQIKNVLVNGEAITAVDGKYSFVMPDADVTITVEFKGRLSVNLSAVEGKITASNTAPLEGEEVTIATVAPYVIKEVFVNGTKLEAIDGVYKFTATENVDITGSVTPVEGDLNIDGIGGTVYGREFETPVSGNRNMTISAIVTDNGLWLFTTAVTDTNPVGNDNFWSNTNFEFYVNGMRFAAAADRKPVEKDGANAVDYYAYLTETRGEKIHHLLEMFIHKNTLGKAYSNERMQINYAWCIPGEHALVIDTGNARDIAKTDTANNQHWWGQARIGGVANADWQWGSGYTLPANLFATKAGLVTTANEKPADEQIDGVASEKYGSTYVETGNYDKAHVKVQGFVGTDGLYFLLTINHKNKSAISLDGWHLNDNIEFVVNDTWAAITFVEGQFRGSGLITKSYYNCTSAEGNYTTTVEFFIPITNPTEVYGIRFGIAGNGFGGWQEGYWGDRYIRVTANGVGSENVAQIAENINIDGRLDDEFWNGTTKWENTNTLSADATHGTKAYIQAKRGNAGVYVGVTMYHKASTSTIIQQDGTAWWHYINIEFRFGTNWDASIQRACCIWNNGVILCDFAYTTVESDLEGYNYKTVFEIFVANESLGEYATADEVPLLIACVSDGGWGWLLDPYVNTTQPNTVTRTDFIRK